MDLRGIENLIKKKKSISYSYHLGVPDPINIDYHFGDVKVEFERHNKIKANIVITVNAPTEKSKYLLEHRIYSQKYGKWGGKIYH
ncbi:MAG: hypothetical protein ACI9QN_000627 [Arcticibacterium sp.]